jgi:diguanylate cyclase
MTRLFAIYAVASLLPVLALSLVLARSFRTEANREGLGEGRAQAALIARTAVEPLLDGHRLGRLTVAERRAAQALARRVIARGDVLRMRIRDLRGRVVFSGDGSGLTATADDEAIEASHGETVAKLTTLNSDANDVGRRGVATVEVYLGLHGGSGSRILGVLEIYLPYAQIAASVDAAVHRLYLELATGMVILYLVLFAITASVSRGMRGEAALNAFLAERDVLTGLPNRTLFLRRAERALHDAGGTGESVAIAIVDLDRFKDSNDALGHRNGDLLLSELAGRLAASMRPGDTVARLGGDEFGIIVLGASDPVPVLERVRAVIDREIDVRGLPLSVQASLGYVLAPADGVDVDDLLQRADVAMYVAKANHAGVTRYGPSLDHYDAACLTLASELRRAIDDDQLVLHYQPQARLSDGAIGTLEALVRWQHPSLGLLYPDRFLALAERTDLIDKLTSWVLARALRDVHDLHAIDPAIGVAVNVSARTIGRSTFADEVLAALNHSGVDGERLTVEVTETALLADPRGAAEVLAALAQAGVSTSLDDFGQGQTSLGYLSELPLHEIKIDKGFVLDMLENPSHSAIVRSIIDLGHNLSLRVVAEGVETEEVRLALVAQGADIAQGYLLARPMPIDVVEAWLVAARARALSGRS